MVNWRNHSPANVNPTRNSLEQKQLNSSEKTDLQNSSGNPQPTPLKKWHEKYCSFMPKDPSDKLAPNLLEQDTTKSGWGMHCQRPFHQPPSPNQLSVFTKKQPFQLPPYTLVPFNLTEPVDLAMTLHPDLSSDQSAANSSNQCSEFSPPSLQATGANQSLYPSASPSISNSRWGMHYQPQIYTDEEKFNMRYAETRKKFNSQLANPFTIVGELIWQGTIGAQILEKAYTEKISPNAEKIPEIIAAWMLNAAWMLITSKNDKDVKIQTSTSTALTGLSCTNGEFVAKIFALMKIDENWKNVEYLLAIASVNCAAKLLSILPPATQAKFLSPMDPAKASRILCELCDGNPVQFFGHNSEAIRIKNVIGVLSEIGIDNTVNILVNMISLMQIRYAAIILAKMPHQFRTDTLVKLDIQTSISLLSAMCICGYETSAAEIAKLMDIEKVVLISVAMVLSNSTNNVIIILRMIDPEVTVSIFQKILTLNLHEVAMKIFVKMDSEMMGNMLLVIKKAQDNSVKILEIFKLLSQENVIHVFKTMTKFITMTKLNTETKFIDMGNQLAAEILATVIEQEIVMKVLAALAINPAVKIIKLMYANKLYRSVVIAILPSLAQDAKGTNTFARLGIEFLKKIVILMHKRELHAPAEIITSMGGPKLRENLPSDYAPKTPIEMGNTATCNVVNEKNKTE
ncbi:MAG: hypothetical protein LBI69_00995 [Puniceicoccales bacterium]|jgi:hypothetical protein|nr:hypothetical protein [Puniceicoccales bacterium]